jgi:hypothetical protein
MLTQVSVQSHRTSVRVMLWAFRRPGTAAAVAVLVISVCSLFGGTSPAGASGVPPTAGWTATQLALPTTPDTPSPSQPLGRLEALSCLSPVFCAGVGSFEDTATDVWGTLDIFRGHAWSSEQAPLPANAASGNYIGLDGVSCANDNWCVALGGYIESSGSTASLIETYSRGQWSVQEAPAPADAAGDYAWLQDVSCPAPGVCDAIGLYDTGSSQPYLPYIDTLADGSWSSAPAPVPPGYSIGTYKEFISCPTSAFCGATASNVSEAPLLLQMVDGLWSSESGPLPPDAGTHPKRNFDSIQGLSCVNTSCEGVGNYTDSADDGQILLEHLPAPGASWSATEGLLPPGARTNPEAFGADVSCAPSGFCAAAGSYIDGGGNNQPVLEEMTGGVPTAVLQGPLPPGVTSGVLYGVSCAANGMCAAVGVGDPRATVSAGIIDQLTGGTWNAVAAPVPSDVRPTPQDSFLQFVSCANPVACVAAGSYDTQSDGEQQVIETYGPRVGS